MKQKIRIAASELKPKDMSRTHYTTLGFGTPYPIYVNETIPKDKYRFRVSNFSRLAPMYLPNLGSLTLKLHAFYVPFRLVWNHYENFKEGLPSWNSAGGANVFKNVPLIDDIQLTELFTYDNYQNDQKLAIPVSNASSNFPDFQVGTTDTTVDNCQKYQFTPQGKAVYHMLTALGYNFKFISSYDVTSNNAKNTEYSALPLLCWFKVFLDYYIPSQLQPSSYINKLLTKIHEYTNTELLTPISGIDFGDCIFELCLYYQNNYFTSAWMSPNAPVPGLNNIGSTSSDRPVINSVRSQTSNSEASALNQQIYSSSEYIARTQYNSPNVSGVRVATTDSQLTSDGLTFIQKFARFVKRSNFAGSRAVERILARFGVRVEDFQIGMCRYLGNEDLILQKSDVTVTGNTEQAGEFVGKGFFSGGSNRIFKCDCDLAGMIIVTASLETPSTYLTGVRRHCLHKTPLDYYTPELDGGTFQAISGCEVFHRFNHLNPVNIPEFNSFGFNYDDVFGFSPRYSEYSTSLDEITGDFALISRNANIDSFILPRRLFNIDNIRSAIAGGNNSDFSLREEAYDPLYANNTIQKVSPVETLKNHDMVQFNRIFKELDGKDDPVFSVFRIDCVVNSVTIPLNQSAEIIGRGRALDFETNGVHLS